jgi:GT2 family glycosyltransferase
MRAYTWLFSSFPAAAAQERAARLWKRIRHRLAPPGPATGACDIYAPHGSFVVLSREFFDRGGRIDYGAFLFGEEIHIAEQARSLALRVRYRPELRVFHEEHASVGHYQSRQMVEHARAAAVYCFDRYFRRGT